MPRFQFTDEQDRRDVSDALCSPYTGGIQLGERSVLLFESEGERRRFDLPSIGWGHASLEQLRRWLLPHEESHVDFRHS